MKGENTMYVFFDADRNYVGMFTEEARRTTNIFEVLMDAGYYICMVNHLGDVDPDYFEEPVGEDEED
jgi:hypothetical protein